MQIYEELRARGLIAQVTDEEEIRELVNAGKATFYIGFDATADSLHDGHFLQLVEIFHNVTFNLRIRGPVIGIILGAGFGADGEAARHGHTHAGHFRQVGALAAQQFAHATIALGEQVDVFGGHSFH